jgi:hypothetical protein
MRTWWRVVVGAVIVVGAVADGGSIIGIIVPWR